jgi:serralysin
MPVSLANQPFNIEGILETFGSAAGTAWQYNNSQNGVQQLTYSFSNNSSASFRAIYSAALAELSRYLNINFVQLADEPEFTGTPQNYPRQPGADTSADLRFSQQSDGLREGGQVGIYYWNTTGDSDQEDIDSISQIWTVNYETILHELGHAMTLKHTSPNQLPTQSPFIAAGYQNHNYTVMHYVANGTGNVFNISEGEWAYRHFQLLDVYALQQRFGANQATAGNTVINSTVLQPNEWLQVLWDAGGIDTIDMSDQTRAQRINLATAAFSDVGAIAGNNPSGYNLSVGFGVLIENAVGGTGNDTLYGNTANNALSGGLGNDIIVGFDGDDVLDGGAGANVIVGGAGNDIIIVTGSGNELYGGIGNDVFVVASRSDTIVEYAGEGTDEIRTNTVIYDLAASPNVENLTFTDNVSHSALGNALGNVMTGGTGSDTLSALDGNDRLVGGTGAANTVIGGTGDDIFVVSVQGDTIIEYLNEGIDTVETTTTAFTLRQNVENLIFTGSGNFTGVGFSNNNMITGGAGSDFLSGVDGDDILIGRSGADELLGGLGADQFRYVGGEIGYDRIYDFSPGVDRIGLSSSGFARTTTIAFVSSATPVATSANSTFLYNTSNGILSYDADGNGGGAAVQLAQLNTGLTLTVSDFIFY